MPPDTIVIVTAYNEADRLPGTLAALADVFPGARVVVADDGSSDPSSHVALQAGVEVVRSPVTIGKGGVATLAAERVMAQVHEPHAPVVVLCDGDLDQTARQLPSLADAVRAGECDLAIASFAKREGGGFGIALTFARWVVQRLVNVTLDAPISGQRAMRGDCLPVLVPFAPRFGMETGMNIDAARAGFRIREIEIDLAHRATGRTFRGFIHRGRQLMDFARVYVTKR